MKVLKACSCQDERSEVPEAVSLYLTFYGLSCGMAFLTLRCGITPLSHGFCGHAQFHCIPIFDFLVSQVRPPS